MATPQSPDTRPTDLETPGDVDTPDAPAATLPNIPIDVTPDIEQAIAQGIGIASEQPTDASSDTSTDGDTLRERVMSDADILREQAISDSQARDDVQAKQDDDQVEREVLQ